MMDREWRAILARYGQEAVVYDGEETPGVHVRAFLQPVLEKSREQEVPSPLGLRREDRFLYLGPADMALTVGISRVEVQGQVYEVQSAHLVGESHWWAVLRPRDKEAV